MYKTYIQGYDTAMAVLTEAMKKYPQFAEVVREFEVSTAMRWFPLPIEGNEGSQSTYSYNLLIPNFFTV